MLPEIPCIWEKSSVLLEGSVKTSAIIPNIINMWNIGHYKQKHDKSYTSLLLVLQCHIHNSNSKGKKNPVYILFMSLNHVGQ